MLHNTIREINKKLKFYAIHNISNIVLVNKYIYVH